MTDTVFEVKRGPFRYDAQGLVNQTYQETKIFTSLVSLSGVTLPAYWDGNAFRRFVKHLRLLYKPALQAEWIVCFETSELPVPDAENPERCNLVQVVKLDQPVTGIAFRLECEAVHATGPRFTGREQNPRCEQVPFALFSKGTGRERAKVIWDASRADKAPEIPVNEMRWAPELTRKTCRTDAPPDGIRCRQQGDSCTLENDWCKIGFSLRRPLLTFFSWDSERTGRHQENLLDEKSIMHDFRTNPPWHGPLLFDDGGRTGPFQMGQGQVSLVNSKVLYDQFRISAEITSTVSFELLKDKLILDAGWDVARDRTVYEADLWRLIFDLKRTVTCLLAPLADPHTDNAQARCIFPAVLHAPNFGSVKLSLLNGDPETTFLTMDSHRAEARLRVGLQAAGLRLSDGDLRLSAGKHRVRIQIEPVDVTPATHPMHPTYHRTWGSFFAFRPELMGMSNNSASVNCLFTIHQFADSARATDRTMLPDIHGLTRYSLEMLLRGGSGYGHPDYFMDSNPSILIAAATLSEEDPDTGWLAEYWERIRSRAEAVVNLCNADGLVVCSRYSANSGERVWSCNWWDVVTFGHIDAYSNALAFRALSLTARMAGRLGEQAHQQRYAAAAAKLKAVYWPTLFNPSTGWIAGWKSEDGELHDYAFVMINSMAVCFGLVPEAEQKPLMERIQQRFRELNYDSWHLGVPGVLKPLPVGDTPREGSGDRIARADGQDLFEVYQAGGATMSMAYYYVRALGITNRPERQKIEQAILDSFEDRIPVGGLHAGTDWRMWDGTCCGYEGLLTDQFYVLLAILQNNGYAPHLLI